MSLPTSPGSRVAAAPILLQGCDTFASQNVDHLSCRQLPATSRCALLLLPFDDVAMEGDTSAARIAVAASTCFLLHLWLSPLPHFWMLLCLSILRQQILLYLQCWCFCCFQRCCIFGFPPCVCPHQAQFFEYTSVFGCCQMSQMLCLSFTAFAECAASLLTGDTEEVLQYHTEAKDSGPSRNQSTTNLVQPFLNGASALDSAAIMPA